MSEDGDKTIRQDITIQWIQKNVYEAADQQIAREFLFSDFENYCINHHDFHPSPGLFGKCVKIVFPNVNSRRLGSRGDSKYHYIGLALKNETNTVLYPCNNLSAETDKIFQQCIHKIIIKTEPSYAIIPQVKQIYNFCNERVRYLQNSTENTLWIFEIDLLIYSAIIDYVYTILLPNHIDKIQTIKQILDLTNDFKEDLLRINNAFKETLHECLQFYEQTCEFFTKCISYDVEQTLYDFSVSDFSWIPGRFADCFKESKYKRNFKNVPFYLEKALSSFKTLKEWSKFGSSLQFDKVQMIEVDVISNEFKWYLQQIRKELSVSGFTNGKWIKDATPWLELYFSLHLIKTATLDENQTSEFQLVTLKRSNGYIVHHLVRNGFFENFKSELASSNQDDVSLVLN